MEILKKSFNDCNLKFLEKNFDLEQVDMLAALESWINTDAEISDFEHESLIRFRQVLAFNIHDWNEYELDSHFIGPIFTLINFSSKKFNHYSQRFIKGIVGNFELSGKPDGIISSGRREPENPFFAFQEYKRELDPDGDPAGQALAAMLVGQSFNDDPNIPIYGCYINGRDWYFMTLVGNQYAISQDFSAVTDDVFEIFKTLKALKEIVKERTA
jgi:hypothetical protein